MGGEGIWEGKGRGREGKGREGAGGGEEIEAEGREVSRTSEAEAEAEAAARPSEPFLSFPFLSFPFPFLFLPPLPFFVQWVLSQPSASPFFAPVSVVRYRKEKESCVGPLLRR
jgi:hypothetical protein